MNIVSVGEKPSYFYADNTIRGVELDGLEDAILAARCLGTYALNLSEGPINLPGVSNRLAAEALTIQAQLLNQISLGGIGDEPFGFRVEDGQAGRVLRGAIEGHADRVDTSTVRPMYRFPEQLPFNVFERSQHVTTATEDKLPYPNILKYLRKEHTEEKYPEQIIPKQNLNINK